MQTKYYRILLIEKQFRPHMLILLGVFVFMLIFNGFVSSRKKALDQVKVEKELVMNIPIMEKLYAAKTQKRPIRPVVLKEGPVTLEGTYVENDKTYALINGSVLSEGDVYGDYTVVQIDFGVAILDNIKTKERKILQFFYYE